MHFPRTSLGLKGIFAITFVFGMCLVCRMGARISSVLRTTHKCVGRGGVKKRGPIGMTGTIHNYCQCQTLAHGFTKRPVGSGRVVFGPGWVRPGSPSYLKMRSSSFVLFVGLELEQMPLAFGSSPTSTCAKVFCLLQKHPADQFF